MDTSEQQLFESLTIDLHIVIREVSTYLVNKVTLDLNHWGLLKHRDYFYWILLGSRDKWPPMPANQKKLLEYARWILPEGGGFPTNYKTSYKVPPVEVEEKIDQYIVAFAKWCYISLTTMLWNKYELVIRNYVSEYANLHPDVPQYAIEAHLKTAYEIYMEKENNEYERVLRDTFFTMTLF